MAKIYLVDGSGYIFRAYYAVRPLSNADGLPTNALFGFTKMLTKLLKDVDAEHIAVCFDTGQPTFRHEMYDEYKANRGECPEDLVPQMPYFRSITTAMGLPCLEKVGFEADDVIATLSKHCESEGHEVVIVSGDKDLMQLVSDSVTVWDGMRDIRYDRPAVVDKFGVPPEQIRDYLAIVGDTSDNVPGVKGLGPKAAQALLTNFNTIEELLERREEIAEIKGLRGAKSIAAKLSDAEEVLLLSQRLVSLDCLVEPYTQFAVPDDLKWKGANDEELEPLFEELDFTSLLTSIQQVENQRGVGPDSVADELPEEKKFSLLSKDSYPAFLKALSQQEEFAFDTETSSLDVTACELLGISFSWKSGEAFYLPLKSKDQAACFPLEQIRGDLGEIFANPKIRKVGLNLKYDAAVLLQHDFEISGLFFDVMLASHLLKPDGGEHGLKALALRYLGEEMLSYKELVEGEEKLEDVELEKVSKYACHDADASWNLYKIFAQKLDEIPDLKSAFEIVEMPLVYVLAQIELAGIKVDLSFLENLGTEFSEEADALKAKAMELAGEEFNVNSTQQLAEILFVKLGIPTKGVKKTKTGFSTNASVLTKLASEHEIARVLLDYREVHKLNSTYVEALQRLAKEGTARVHSSFNQAIAATGRLTSSDPNLQNIPIRNPRGRRIRSAFVAEEGHQLIAADYSQIELRVLAHLSGDENMIAAFNDGVDIHSRTAEQIFGVISGDDAEKSRLRRIAKTINFGIVYGVSAFRLASDIGVSRARAQEYIDDYFARYPKIRSYYEGLEANLDEEGFVETMFGRRRFLKGLNMQGRDAGYALRSMLNAPIQGTAAEIIKRAMVKLYERLSSNSSNARIVLQVHDELLVEVRDEASEEVIDIVKDEMESAISLSVPLKVDLRCSKRWGDAV